MEMKNIFMYASHSSLLYWQDIENFTAKMLQFTLEHPCKTSSEVKVLHS